MQKGFSVIFIIVAVATSIVVGGLVWQYNLYQKLSQRDLSCGGDWSYNVQCPIGSYCQTLNHGELAGGLCKPYLSSLFEATKTSKSTSTLSPSPEGRDYDAIIRADIKQIQFALELYFNTNKHYPSTLKELSPNYLISIPYNRYDNSEFTYRFLNTDYDLSGKLEDGSKYTVTAPK